MKHDRRRINHTNGGLKNQHTCKYCIPLGIESRLLLISSLPLRWPKTLTTRFASVFQCHIGGRHRQFQSQDDETDFQSDRTSPNGENLTKGWGRAGRILMLNRANETPQLCQERACTCHVMIKMMWECESKDTVTRYVGKSAVTDLAFRACQNRRVWMASCKTYPIRAYLIPLLHWDRGRQQGFAQDGTSLLLVSCYKFSANFQLTLLQLWSEALIIFQPLFRAVPLKKTNLFPLYLLYYIKTLTSYYLI